MKKMAPNSPDFEKIILPIARFLLLVPVDSEKYRFFPYFCISTCGQIWLNHFQDDSHLGYITKLEKETLHGHVNEIISTCFDYERQPQNLLSNLLGVG